MKQPVQLYGARSAAPGDANADGIDDAFAANNPDGLTISLDGIKGISRAKAILRNSDTDGDGDLDDIIMLSDRGVTAYEYTRGTLVEVDHLEGIEAFFASQYKRRHNANDLISPETMQFIDVNEEKVLLVGFEGDTGISGGIGIYSFQL